MANVKLTFYGTDFTINHKLKCGVNNYNEILITLQPEGELIQGITLDKSTAIRFAKTLRTEINKIEE